MSAASTGARTRQANIARSLARHGEILVFLLLFVLGGIGATFSPVFLTWRNISNVLRQASVLGIVSVGQTIAVLAYGIDLSVSSVASLANCLCAGLMQGRPEKVLPATGVALAAGLMIGLVNGLAITKLRLTDFIVTLAMWSIANGLMFLYTEGREVGRITRGFISLSEGSIGPLPTSFVIWGVIAVATIVFLRYTRTGRHIYAVGGNAEVARLSGINVNRMKTLCYALSGLFAALAGVVLTARLQIVFNLVGVASFSQWVIKGLVIIAVVAVRSRGGRG